MSRDRSPEMDAFVAEAKSAGIIEAFERCGYQLNRLRRAGSEYVGPCPACGGKDRFSLAPDKGVFNCRGFGGGGAVDLALHLTGQDFLDACEILTGSERPDRVAYDERERAQRRREAEAKLAAQRAKAAEDDARRDAEANHYRERERQRCLDLWRESFAGDAARPTAFDYLAVRGLDVRHIGPGYLRTHSRLGFFVKRERGPLVAIHHGPAMVAQFVRPGEGRWEPIGVHLTWFDLDAGPKFRPALAHPDTGEAEPTKKMRGTKAGGLIPVIGRISTATRMVAGEGIETALGFAAFDGFRADTFYCAAGDLGNLCGKAKPGSAKIRHPTLRRAVKGGRSKPVEVPGFEPDMEAVCLPVPGHIRELVLLGDGDSDPVFTRAALKRGLARHAQAEREVRSMFAPAGSDWGDFRAEAA